MPRLLPLLLGALVLSACTNKSVHLTTEAREAADGFMFALVVERSARRAQQYADESLGDLTSVVAGLNKEGAYRRVGSGRIESPCGGADLLGRSPDDDCVSYRLRARGRSGDFIVSKRIEFRLWLDQTRSGWKVIAYQEYAPEGSLRPADDESPR